MTEPIQVTPPDGALLQGKPHVMAMQLCQQVLNPLLLEMVKHEGPFGILEFYAAFVTHVALDMRIALGTKHAGHIMEAASFNMRAATHLPSPIDEVRATKGVLQ